MEPDDLNYSQQVQPETPSYLSGGQENIEVEEKGGERFEKEGADQVKVWNASDREAWDAMKSGVLR